MKFFENVSIGIDSTVGNVNATLQTNQFEFWSGLFGGKPFKTQRWNFTEDELVPLVALSIACTRLARAGVDDSTISEFRKNAIGHSHLYRT